MVVSLEALNQHEEAIFWIDHFTAPHSRSYHLSKIRVEQLSLSKQSKINLIIYQDLSSFQDIGY